MGCGQEEFGDIVYFLEDGFHRVHGDSLSTKKDHGGHHTSVSPIFIAAGPGIKKGATTNRVLRQVDVAPTLSLIHISTFRRRSKKRWPRKNRSERVNVYV